MANTINIRITDHSEDVMEQLDENITRALMIIGGMAEGYAKGLCPVDTGLLRNSITFALDGETPQITSYHAQYGSNRTATGKRMRATSRNAGSVNFGTYSGVVPAESDGRRSVSIGSNVEYASYIENGGSKKAPNGFLRPAIVNHLRQYENILRSELSEE